MNYNQAVEYMTSMEKFGMKLGLDTIKILLKRLGNPQKPLKIIHIAGTNGKGSTSCFLTNILLASGYSVGTFNSPSVFKYNERFLLNGESICDDDLADLISEVKDERDKMRQEGLDLPSAFELEFAAAALLFNRRHCDFVILECGLGGRLDATNAVDAKELAIITSISYDHTAILGNTLEEIAEEKFAVVKGCPLVTFNQTPEVMSVLGKAENLLICDTPKSLSSNVSGQIMQYGGEVYRLKQLGRYQLVNCALAIESALYLAKKGYSISAQSIKQGVETAVWKGRLQLVRCGEKLFLLDGAHNADGAKVLADELSDNFKDLKKCFVFGMFKDKDVDGVLTHIGKLADRFITIKPPTNRGLDENETREKCLKYTPNCIALGDMQSAIDEAYASDCELIAVCGSLSILSSALDGINKINKLKKS